MNDTSLSTISLSDIQAAVRGTAAAFRCVTEYLPAGGPEDTVFPPTYEGGKYAMVGAHFEEATGKKLADRIILDSVQSQANRHELALLDAWERKRIPLPVVTVDFSGHDMPKVLRISSLEAPHRIVDAILRDSLLGKERFRESKRGKQLDHIDNRNATPLFELCPTALVFGVWDSTGPRGGLGAKFARAVVSEIVGIDVQLGIKTASRIDPLQVVLQAGPLYLAKEGGWTLDEDDAVRDKKSPVKLGKDGRPSEANHGNVTPTVADGGVVIRGKVLQTTVLSLPALRRLRFPINGKTDPKADDAARTVLAALALCAATLVRESGCDLRSRCQLHPTSAFVWELLDKPGETPQQFTLDSEKAVELYQAAVQAAKRTGLPWLDEELVLEPSPQLVALVRKSQELAAKVEGVEE